MTEKEELLELFAHKLRFVEQKPSYAAIAAVQPLQFRDLAQAAVFGAQNLAKQTGHLPQTAELILFQIPGKGIAEILASLAEIAALEDLSATNAALNGRLILLDDILFQAADEVKQLEILAEIFYPKFFAFGYEGTAWAKLHI